MISAKNQEEKIENKTVKEKYEPMPGCWDVFYWYFKINYEQYFDTPSIKNISGLSKWHHEECAVILASRACVVYDINTTDKEHLERFHRMLQLYKSDSIKIKLNAGGIVKKKARRDELPAFVIRLPDNIEAVDFTYNKLEMSQKGFKCIELYHTAKDLYLRIQNYHTTDTDNVDRNPFLIIKEAGNLVVYSCENVKDVLLPSPDYMQSAQLINLPYATLIADKNSQFYRNCEDLCISTLISLRPLVEWQRLTSLILKYEDKYGVFSSQFIVPSSLRRLEVYQSGTVIQIVPSENFLLDIIVVDKLHYAHFSRVAKLAKRILFNNLLNFPTNDPMPHNSQRVICPPSLELLEYLNPYEDDLKSHAFLDFRDTDMIRLNIAHCFVFRLPSKCRTLELYRSIDRDHLYLDMPDNLITIRSNESFGYADNPLLPASIKNIRYGYLHALPRIHSGANDVSIQVKDIKNFSSIGDLAWNTSYLTSFACDIRNHIESYFWAFSQMKNIQHLDIRIKPQNGMKTKLQCPPSLRTLIITFLRGTGMHIVIIKNGAMTDRDITIVDKGLNSVTY